MSLFKRRARNEQFLVEIGDPWRINGTATAAASAADVRAEIEAMADLPVEVVFQRPDGQQRTSVLTTEGLVVGTLAEYLEEQEATAAAEEASPESSEDQSLADTLLGDSEEDPHDEPTEPTEPTEPGQAESDPAETPHPVVKAPRGMRRASSHPVASSTPTGVEDSPQEPSVSEVSAEEDSSEGEEPASGSTQRRHRRWVVAGGGVMAVAVLVGAGALVGAAVSGGSPDLPLEPAVAVPEGAEAVDLGEGSVVGMTEGGVYVLDGEDLVVRDPQSGETVGEPMTAPEEDQIRISSAGATDVVAVSDDRFYLRSEDGSVEESEGRVSLRGATPVAVKGEEYTVLPEISWDEIPKQAGVFGGIGDQAVFAKAPDQVVVDGDATTLKAPEKDAEIEQWLQVTETSAVVLWKTGKTTTLAVHSIDGGQITDETEVDPSEVAFTAGSVRIGDTRYVADDGIQELCEDGALVGATVFCPTDADTWETPDGAVASTRPVAATENTYVTETNQAVALSTP